MLPGIRFGLSDRPGRIEGAGGFFACSGSEWGRKLTEDGGGRRSSALAAVWIGAHPVHRSTRADRRDSQARKPGATIATLRGPPIVRITAHQPDPAQEIKRRDHEG